jgi:hypothetical protein
LLCRHPVDIHKVELDKAARGRREPAVERVRVPLGAFRHIDDRDYRLAARGTDLNDASGVTGARTDRLPRVEGFGSGEKRRPVIVVVVGCVYFGHFSFPFLQKDIASPNCGAVGAAARSLSM